MLEFLVLLGYKYARYFPGYRLLTLFLQLYLPITSSTSLFLNMKNAYTLAAFAAGAQALVARGDSCCFHLDASGDMTGSVGQLSDGQNRIGDGSLSPAQYCISSDGSITDGNGRGCILTRE
jgi:hypothetical protein